MAILAPHTALTAFILVILLCAIAMCPDPFIDDLRWLWRRILRRSDDA